MVMIRPFRALRYAAAQVGDVAQVVAPPYDVINDAERDRLYGVSEFNVIRLILNRDEDRYASAARHLNQWIAQRVLQRDAAPALYYYEEEFRLPNGGAFTRRGVLSAVRLEPFSAGVIRPHEKTFARAKKDRMALLEECKTNLSPIFGLVASAPEVFDPLRAAAARQAPCIELTDQHGWRHRVWAITDADSLSAVIDRLRDETVFIADGHHRYETALEYRDTLHANGAERATAAHNFILMYLTSMSEPGLLVLPTHRVLGSGVHIDAAALLQRFDEWFEAKPFARNELVALRAYLAEHPERARFAVGLQGRDDLLALSLKNPQVLDQLAATVTPTVRQLDVTVLDAVVLRGLLGIDCVAAEQAGELSYTHDDADAVAKLDAGAAAVFVMNAPRLSAVAEVCLAGEVMPQKSTYFYPKLLSGLVLHPLT